MLKSSFGRCGASGVFALVALTACNGSNMTRSALPSESVMQAAPAKPVVLSKKGRTAAKYFQWYSQSNSVADGPSSVFQFCPKTGNTFPVSGGASGPTGAYGIYVQNAAPLVQRHVNAGGWYWNISNDGGKTQVLTTWLLCTSQPAKSLHQPLGLQAQNVDDSYPKSTTTNDPFDWVPVDYLIPANTQEVVTVYCPPTGYTFVVAGGADWQPLTQGGEDVGNEYPTASFDGWNVLVTNPGQARYITVFALCMKRNTTSRGLHWGWKSFSVQAWVYTKLRAHCRRGYTLGISGGLSAGDFNVEDSSPDQTFDGWEDVGIDSYSETVKLYALCYKG